MKSILNIELKHGDGQDSQNENRSRRHNCCAFITRVTIELTSSEPPLQHQLRDVRSVELPSRSPYRRSTTGTFCLTGNRVQILHGAPGDKCRVHISSPGGTCFDGEELRREIKVLFPEARSLRLLNLELCLKAYDPRVRPGVFGDPVSSQTPSRPPRLSPSGTQLLVEMDEATPGRSAIWLYDLVAGTRTRLTFNEVSAYPVWSHDGRKMAFNVGQTSNEVHVHDLASGAESTLFSELGSGSSFVGDWSPDDRYVFYDLHRPGFNWEIWVAESTGQHNRYPLVQATGDARWARLSPDGKWLAYAGGETGRPEIYVVPIDFTGAQPKAAANKSQISTDGGNLPVWAKDGKELFFTNPAGTTLYAAPFTTTGGVAHAGTASKLFDLSQHSYAFFYDVSPDGKKFYVAEAPPGSSPPLTVVTNWQARIKK